jgi:hypothetical protein
MEGYLDAGELASLWMVPTLTYGVGDMLTTMAAVNGVSALSEGNPFVATALELGGTPGFVTLKLLVLLVGLGVAVRAGRSEDLISYYAMPTLLAVLGAFLTTYNAQLLIAT